MNEVHVDMHVVTHSHLDAGWVYSVNKCYKTVKYIFNSVLKSLKEDKTRKYTVGDIYFFQRWFHEELDSKSRDEVRLLVKSGQIEIVNGGAVSTDEALVNHNDIIDN